MDLMSNPRVKGLFGNVAASKVAGVEEQWAKTSWIANGHTLILPRGAGQQVRGLKWIRYRPDLWIVDDLEDDEGVMNEEQRKKLREWFFSAFLYTVNQYEGYGQDYEIIYIDTVKHEDALITYLLDDPEWASLQLSVCDDNYKTLAPEFLSQETLDKEIEHHRLNKTMDIFSRERMCQPVSRETRSFKTSYFRYYNEDDEHFVKEVRPRLINILVWDPSRSKNPKNSQTGLVVWGLDLEYGGFYVRHSEGEFYSQSEQHDQIFNLCDRYNVQVIGGEVTGLEEHLTYPFKNECIRRRKPALAGNFIELRARVGKGELKGDEGGKDGRIRGLLPHYERGLVWHNRANCGPLEQQLISFPRSKRKDIADAAAYLNQMLNKGTKYMSPPESGETRQDIEREYDVVRGAPPMRRRVFR